MTPTGGLKYSSEEKTVKEQGKSRKPSVYTSGIVTGKLARKYLRGGVEEYEILGYVSPQKIHTATWVSNVLSKHKAEG